MRSRVIALAAIPLVLLLAGCVPAATPSSHTTVSTPQHSASATPTLTPAPAPTPVDPAGFLTLGDPGVPDSDGEWVGRYTFFTDASKSVLCTMTVFSGDPGGIDCQVLPDSLAKRTYALPAGVTSTCSPVGSQGVTSDGSEIDMGSEALYPANVGWEGCITDPAIDPAVLAATKVLQPSQVMTITHDTERWTCAVTTSKAVGTAHCSSAQSATASLTFGLSEASFTQ
jgi:hypothetical protein